jgi:hypothetical protein
MYGIVHKVLISFARNYNLGGHEFSVKIFLNLLKFSAQTKWLVQPAAVRPAAHEYCMNTVD